MIILAIAQGAVAFILIAVFADGEYGKAVWYASFACTICTITGYIYSEFHLGSKMAEMQKQSEANRMFAEKLNEFMGGKNGA